MPRLRLDRLARSHGSVRALDGITLDVADGEHLAIVGPSGGGKTTLLRLVAGLDAPDAGTVRIDERDATADAPEDRGLGMVFQMAALLPHRTVAAHLALALELRGVAKSEHDARIRDIAAQLGIADKLGRRPAELSGGETQRVALGRALVGGAKLLLLDEPFTGLDAPLRRGFRALLRQLRANRGLTIVHVTHDQHEALALADRVALLAGGRLVQCATPREIVARPASVFAADFFAEPPPNWIDGTMRVDAGRGFFVPDNGETAWAIGRPVGAGRKLRLGLRPGNVRWNGAGARPRPGWTAIARRVEFGPSRDWIVAEVGGNEWRIARDGDVDPAAGTRGEVAFETEAALWFDPQTGLRIEPD